jgi:hypothetical protein
VPPTASRAARGRSASEAPGCWPQHDANVEPARRRSRRRGDGGARLALNDSTISRSADAGLRLDNNSTLVPADPFAGNNQFFGNFVDVLNLNP